MESILLYLPILIVLYGFIHYTVIKMKELGVIFTILNYLKWFVGVSFTFFAFYTIHISSIFFKENDLSVLLSLPVGILVWFLPMNYLSKKFQYLEDKYKFT